VGTTSILFLCGIALLEQAIIGITHEARLDLNLMVVE